jgi:hypothetical protein
MILTIRVDDLLEGAVPVPSRDLVTRPTGAAVRSRIERVLAATACPTARLDFGAIGLIDFSCADEVVAKLVLAIGAGPYLVLLGLDEVKTEAIDLVLSKQNLSVTAVEPAGGPRLLGRSTPDQLAAFDAVHRWGPAETRVLARHLEWAVERTHEALHALAVRRLVVASGASFSPIPL